MRLLRLQRAYISRHIFFPSSFFVRSSASRTANEITSTSTAAITRYLNLYQKAKCRDSAPPHPLFLFAKAITYNLLNELLTTSIWSAFGVVTFRPQFALHQLVNWLGCICGGGGGDGDPTLSPHIILLLFSNAFNLVNAHNMHRVRKHTNI